jgi:glutamate 5-kinase
VTRQVIKLGSSSIERSDGLALDVIASLVSQIAVAQRAGHEIILVTSGAARLGRRLLAFEGPTAGAAPALQALVSSVRSALGTTAREPADGLAGLAGVAGDQGDHVNHGNRPKRNDPGGRVSRPQLAANGTGGLVDSLTDALRSYISADAGLRASETALPSAVGQPALMALYRQLAAAVGVEVCQILVSRSDLSSARAMADIGQLLREAVGRGLLPIVNGNDATDPLSALDNDQVAVAIAVAAEAPRLLFLTDVPAAYRDSSLTERIGRLTPAEARAVRVAASGTGRGGMGSKLSAAARAACCGVECTIGSAREADVVARSLNPRARMGTVVRAAGPQLEPARRWIGGMAYSAGSVHVNREAEESLRSGSTLFLSGVKRVDGDFAAGSVVELLDVRHPERLLGRGSVALPSAILRLLRALSPQEVACVISIMLRLKYAGTATGSEPDAADRRPASLLDPDVYKDSRELADGSSRASQEAYAQLAGSSPERIAELADSLLLAQPAVSAAFLINTGFLHGQVPAGPAARRIVRSIHAVRRESLVVFPG